jgi:hypothetical protein
MFRKSDGSGCLNLFEKTATSLSAHYRICVSALRRHPGQELGAQSREGGELFLLKATRKSKLSAIVI